MEVVIQRLLDAAFQQLLSRICGYLAIWSGLFYMQLFQHLKINTPGERPGKKLIHTGAKLKLSF